MMMEQRGVIRLTAPHHHQFPVIILLMVVLAVSVVMDLSALPLAFIIVLLLGHPGYPLAAASADGGTTWKYTIDSSTSPAVPSDYFNNAVFSVVSCSGLSCVASGFYNSTITGHPFYPLLAASTNGGFTWSYNSTSTMLLPGDFFSISSSNSMQVYCNTATCIAVGQYTSTNTKIYPLILTSVNNGLTWSTTIDSSIILPSDFLNNGLFTAINCDGFICVASGQYTSTNTKSYPLIATSINGGITWSYTLDSTITILPSDYLNNGIFNSVSVN